MTDEGLFHIVFLDELAIAILREPDGQMGVKISQHESKFFLTPWLREGDDLRELESKELTDDNDFFLTPRAQREIGRLLDIDIPIEKSMSFKKLLEGGL